MCNHGTCVISNASALYVWLQVQVSLQPNWCIISKVFRQNYSLSAFGFRSAAGLSRLWSSACIVIGKQMYVLSSCMSYSSVTDVCRQWCVLKKCAYALYPQLMLHTVTTTRCELLSWAKHSNTVIAPLLQHPEIYPQFICLVTIIRADLSKSMINVTKSQYISCRKIIEGSPDFMHAYNTTAGCRVEKKCMTDLVWGRELYDWVVMFASM